MNFLKQSIDLQANTNIFCEKLLHFWEENPCLLYGVIFLLADALILNFNHILFFPLSILFLPLLFFKSSSKALIQKILLSIALLLMSLLYFYFFTILPSSDYPVEGRGIFTIQSIQECPHSYGNRWIYKGTLLRFKNKKDIDIAKNIPCILLSKNTKENRPLANCNYLIEGQLSKNRDSHSYFLKSHGDWTPIPNTYSFSELRFNIKKQICSYIDHFIQNKRSAIFLKGICTGEFNDVEMKYEFSRFGLQHIMAISGFHFSIIAGFFNFLLSFFFSRKYTAALLIFIMCTYFLFLGPNPSVMRAWVMVFIVILGTFMEQRSKALNSLGISIFIILIYDPFLIKHIGFQFSVGVTAAILSLYQIIDLQIQFIFPKKKLYQAIEMNLIDKHGYCIIAWIRKAISLSLSVNLVALPMTLFYFNKFPLLGLIYNWFFPFLVSVSIILLIFGLLFFMISPIAALIHSINSSYTFFILNFAYNLPKKLDIYIRLQNLRFEFLIILLTFLFFWSIFFRNSQKEQKDFALI